MLNYKGNIGSWPVMAIVFALGLLPQETMSAESDAPQFEEITVTGSYIRRNSFDTASPMQIMDQMDLSATGSVTMGDVVQNLVINTGSQVQSDFSSSSAFGTSQFNLRGLGFASTLTLVNGRRVTQNAISPTGVSFVDVNQFPMNMLERVEILKDGAAALYGSDAVAGVVNLITREVDGVEAELGYQTTTNMETKNGDKDNTRDITANAAFGTGNDRGHIDIFFSHLRRSAVHDNEIFEGLFTSYGFPGAFRLLESPVSGPYAGTPAGAIMQDPDCGELGGLNPSPTGTGVCRANLAPTSFDFIPKEQRSSVFAKARYDINDNLKVFGEISYANNDAYIIQNQTNAFIRNAVFVPADHPDNIYGVRAQFLGRFSIAPKHIDYDNTNFRAMGGAGYEFGNDWYAELAYVFSQNTTQRTTIRTFGEAAQAALDGVGGPNGDARINPFGSSLTGDGTPNDPALLEYLSVEVPYSNKSSIQTVDFYATGPVVDLPAGPLSVAFGGQRRLDSLRIQVDSSMLVDVDGTYAPSSNLPKTTAGVWAGFVEFSAPILDNLELSAALRYEDFGSSTGNTTDPKVTLRWEPLEEIALRGSYSTSFRAPSILQTSTPLISSAANIIDPFSGTPGQCNGSSAVVARVNSSGNPDLKPEKSKNYNLGVAVSPVSGFQASLDYWRYNYTDIIGLVSAQSIVTNDCLDDGIRNDPRVVLDSTGTIIQDVNSSYFNQAKVKTDGLDLTAIYGFDTEETGSFSIGVNASYILSLELQNDPLSAPIDGKGSRNKLNSLPPAPKLRGNVALGWAMGEHGANVIMRYVDSVENDQLADEKIPSMTTFDAQYSYNFAGLYGTDTAMRLTLGMINIFDKKAPMIAGEFTGFISDMHDPRGRIIYVKLKSEF